MTAMTWEDQPAIEEVAKTKNFRALVEAADFVILDGQAYPKPEFEEVISPLSEEDRRRPWSRMFHNMQYALAAAIKAGAEGVRGFSAIWVPGKLTSDSFSVDAQLFFFGTAEETLAKVSALPDMPPKP